MPTIVILLILLFMGGPAHAAHATPPIHPEKMSCQQVLKWSTDSYMNIFKEQKVPAPMTRKAVESKFRTFLRSRSDSPCFKSANQPNVSKQ